MGSHTKIPSMGFETRLCVILICLVCGVDLFCAFGLLCKIAGVTCMHAFHVLQFAVCCRVYCVAACCSALQCVAVHVVDACVYLSLAVCVEEYIEAGHILMCMDASVYVCIDVYIEADAYMYICIDARVFFDIDV